MALFFNQDATRIFLLIVNILLLDLDLTLTGQGVPEDFLLLLRLDGHSFLQVFAFLYLFCVALFLDVDVSGIFLLTVNILFLDLYPIPTRQGVQEDPIPTRQGVPEDFLLSLRLSVFIRSSKF